MVALHSAVVRGSMLPLQSATATLPTLIGVVALVVGLAFLVHGGRGSLDALGG